ncbi:hypothetical protein FQZ97_1018170 [compost metagenome]
MESLIQVPVLHKRLLPQQFELSICRLLGGIQVINGIQVTAVSINGLSDGRKNTFLLPDRENKIDHKQANGRPYKSIENPVYHQF